MPFVIFDTEYTTWPGCQECGWHGHQKREIVQLAAIKVSRDLRVLGALNLLCRPTVNPILSDYFIGLTGITNEMVQKQGMSFQKAYRCFLDFVGDSPCLSHGFGRPWTDESDGTIVAENLKINKIIPEKAPHYYNIGAWFQKQYERQGIQNPPKSSGQIVKVLGLESQIKKLGLDEHNALYDVYSILIGVQYFVRTCRAEFRV